MTGAAVESGVADAVEPGTAAAAAGIGALEVLEAAPVGAAASFGACGTWFARSPVVGAAGAGAPLADRVVLDTASGRGP